MKRRDEENTIRFTNLLEDAIESDLRELIAPFGLVSRVHVGIDRKTELCRGFGFLNFVKKEDAERAVLKLNGSKVGEAKAAAGHSLAQQAKNGDVLKLCRTCGKERIPLNLILLNKL
ncbi:hypothetical protein GOBAR_DD04286 [Gossypium barbadense]|nr:hypothetical protein GOBAR_DD04286 [Gossypium barbadense]